MGATSPVTRPRLAMRSRYFGTGSWKYLFFVWAASKTRSREDRDGPMWSPRPLEEPTSRGVTHVSPCLSGGGYDESRESPSAFLIFPTAAVTSRSRRQTPLALRRDPSHGLALDRAPSQ